MAEGARLESVYTATYRGFESPPHRHYFTRKPERTFRLFCMHTAPTRGVMRTPAGFDNRRSRLDSRRLPEGRARQRESIPPHRHYFTRKPERTFRLFCMHTAPTRGVMRTPAGFDNRRSRLDSRRLPAERARQRESIPPSPPLFHEKA